MINKKKKKESKPEEGDDMPKLDRSQHRRAKKKESKKAIPVALTYDDNTEDDMAKRKGQVQERSWRRQYQCRQRRVERSY
jgi:hypothetical protein